MVVKTVLKDCYLSVNQRDPAASDARQKRHCYVEQIAELTNSFSLIVTLIRPRNCNKQVWQKIRIYIIYLLLECDVQIHFYRFQIHFHYHSLLSSKDDSQLLLSLPFLHWILSFFFLY